MEKGLFCRENCVTLQIKLNEVKDMIRLLAVVLFFWCGVLSYAQDTSKAYKNAVAGSYNFWFYHPGDEAGEGKHTKKKHSDGHPVEHRPLLIFLHGASLCGHDLQKVKRYGPLEALKRGRVIDSYILAPQNPGGSWQPAKIMKLVEWAKEHFNVDSTRIYCLGMSLGGYGTMDFCATYPDRVAAGMAICGGATVKDVSGLARMPMWIVHGTADRSVSISASDKVVAAIKKTGDGSRLIYTRLPGIDHGRPARIFYLSQTYDWLFSHSLTDEGRPVNRDFKLTPQILQNAYKDLGKRP